MTRRVVRERFAVRDLRDHVTYLAEENPTVALRFIDAVEHACTQLAAFPEIGPMRHFRHPRLVNIRMWPIPGFQNYLIFYRITTQEIQVLRVLHAVRDLEPLLEEAIV